MDLEKNPGSDPIKRDAQKQSEDPEFSPMDPPDAFAPPGDDAVPYEEMPAFLQGLMDDHVALRSALDRFELALTKLQEDGFRKDAEIDEGLREFFRFYDEQIVDHHTREEKTLFPLLHERLIEIGEHSTETPPGTGVNVMEDDHVKVIQLVALTFNFLGMASRLPDPASRAMVLDAALQQGAALVELLRLHMFREDHVLFTLAAKHLSQQELAELSQQAARATGKS